MAIGWRKIWCDPVWSKVISVVILAIFGLLYALLPSNWMDLLLSIAIFKLEVVAWLAMAILAGITVISVAITRKVAIKINARSVSNLTSKEWFSLIDQQIKDCGSARIYLRNFAHPNEFKAEHRESLLSFMKSLAERLEAGANIQIVAYHASLSNKSGLDWLSSELKTNRTALNNVKLIKTQPISNGSSMYLFDSNTVLYNRRLDGGHSYHSESLHGSILHFFIEHGFDSSKGDLV